MIRVRVLKEFRCFDTNVYGLQWRKMKEVPPWAGEPEKTWRWLVPKVNLEREGHICQLMEVGWGGVTPRSGSNRNFPFQLHETENLTPVGLKKKGIG